MNFLVEMEHLKEKNQIEVLIHFINALENYTRKLQLNELNQSLGFFYARVIDDNLRIDDELRDKIPRAAAFVILAQIFYFVAFNKRKNEGQKIKSQQVRDIHKNFRRITNSGTNPLYKIDLITKFPPDSLGLLKDIFQELESWSPAMMEIDILGKIFHGLIPKDLRKFLSAYYSSNSIADFIVYIVIENLKFIRILDPSCGSGTFLVSAYKRIKEVNPELDHQTILNFLLGVDVSIFASQLASINLALQDPLYPSPRYNLHINDIFKVQIDALNNNTLPQVDILLGNPPFTRGDRIESKYKDFLANHLKENKINIKYNKKYLGLYGYFLLDSVRLLKPGGRLAYILPISVINSSTMNPVLDYIKKFMVFEYFITSDEEVAFSEQSKFKEIILIAKKSISTESTDVKFITLKTKVNRHNYKSLAHKCITNESIDIPELRINSVDSKMLMVTPSTDWVLFFHSKQYIDIYQQIKQNKHLVPVKLILENPRRDTDRGIRVGISDFFYLPNKFWVIEQSLDKMLVIKSKENSEILHIPKSVLSPVLRKSSLYNTIIPKISEYILIFPSKFHDSDTSKYIEWGQKKFARKEGFEGITYNQISRGWKIARVAIIHKFSLSSGKFLSFYTQSKCVISDNFIFIRTHDVLHDKILAAYLNSTIFLLTYLILRREKVSSLGQIFGTDFRNYFILHPKIVKKNDSIKLCAVFDQFIQESGSFSSLRGQLRDLSLGGRTLRYELDYAICEIMRINQIEKFLCQLYETIYNEIIRFKI